MCYYYFDHIPLAELDTFWRYLCLYLVAGSGGKAYDSKFFDQHMAFIVTCTFATYVIAIILLVDFTCCHCLSRKWQVILIALLLILEFAIAVDVAIVASQASILIDDHNILGNFSDIK